MDHYYYNITVLESSVAYAFRSILFHWQPCLASRGSSNLLQINNVFSEVTI